MGKRKRGRLAFILEVAAMLAEIPESGSFGRERLLKLSSSNPSTPRWTTAFQNSVELQR
jgi:hypothetical protein